MLGLLYNMPREELIAQLYDGLVLLVLGMGTVFVFLVLLIYITKIMSKLCMRDPSHPANSKAKAEAAAPAPAARTMAAAPANDDAAVAAAIAAAYDKSRN